MINKLQYISQGETLKDHFENIQAVCDAGVKWVQLRLKDQPEEEVLKAAFIAKEICDLKEVKLIVNDYPAVAAKVGAHGIHLGKQDMDPEEARILTGGSMIIGGTANDLDDCIRLAGKGVDYIGLGPLRFTPTKKKLSPFLGIDGYREILQKLSKTGIDIPIIAIGGVTVEDVPALKKVGVFGVAVSSELTKLIPKQKLSMA